MFARRWHRAGVVTDVEFYKLRYSGKAGEFLRGFRALYLGLIFNINVIAWALLPLLRAEKSDFLKQRSHFRRLLLAQ